MKQLLTRVWGYSKNFPHGFTLNIETFKPVAYGICVGYIETQNCFGFEGLKRAIEHALLHQMIVGGWQGDNELYYFDSVKIFKSSQLQKAIEFGKLNEQQAIYDLTNYREIIIGG